MIGAFVSDDFSFYFEEQDILKLSDNQQVIGVFACKGNTPKNADWIRMKLYVHLFEPREDKVSSDIEIDFDKKIATFLIVREDFENWFIAPDESAQNYGPNVRLASCNTYIARDGQKECMRRKRILQNLIDIAK